MIGPFTNDFLGGLSLGLACTLIGAVAGGLYVLYRFPRPGTPQPPSPPEPDPVPGIAATIDQEWEMLNCGCPAMFEGHQWYCRMANR